MSFELPVEVAMHDTNPFPHHFDLRKLIEENMFGAATISQIIQRAPAVSISAYQLNTSNLAESLTKTKPDVCIVFVTDLTKDPVLGVLSPRIFPLVSRICQPFLAFLFYGAKVGRCRYSLTYQRSRRRRNRISECAGAVAGSAN